MGGWVGVPDHQFVDHGFLSVGPKFGVDATSDWYTGDVRKINGIKR